MNALAGTLIMLWLTFWTLAAVRAGLKARSHAIPACGRPGAADCKSPLKDLPN
jgi:hypothetical protein